MHSQLVLTALIAVSCILLACPPAVEPADLLDDLNQPNGSPRSRARLVGELAGKVRGIEQRSDGIEFEAEWIVVVRFDEDGVLRGLSELFESGETFDIPDVGVPVRREESGDDFSTTRQLTLIESWQDGDTAEIAASYQRWNRYADPDSEPTFFESRGMVRLHLARSGDNVQCQLEREWNQQLPAIESTWIASGELERDGRPKPILSGSYATNTFPGHHFVHTVKFNEFGRLVSVDRADEEPFDVHFHGGTFPRSYIMDIRYQTDRVVIVAERRGDIDLYIDHRYTHYAWVGGQQVVFRTLWPSEGGGTLQVRTIRRVHEERFWSFPPPPKPDPHKFETDIEHWDVITDSYLSRWFQPAED